MLILYQNHNPDLPEVNVFNHIYGTRWDSQVFTPVVNHTIKSVVLLLARGPNTDSYPGNITVQITTCVEGEPDESNVLCEGYTDGDTLPYCENPSAFEWREITFEVTAVLTAETQYATIVKALDGDGVNYVAWLLDSTGASYDRGDSYYTTDGGANWVPQADGYEAYFKEYGFQVLQITDQSTDITAVAGEEINLFITTIGAPDPTYQWYENDVVMPGETDSVLIIYPSSTAIYKCKADNVVSEVISNPVIVAVVSNPYCYNLFNLQLDMSRTD